MAKPQYASRVARIPAVQLIGGLTDDLAFGVMLNPALLTPADLEARLPILLATLRRELQARRDELSERTGGEVRHV